MNKTLAGFVHRHAKLVVITGAGVSTASGIPDYRDEKGQWKHRKPIYFDEFIKSESARQRYWARSAVGWQRFSKASPGKSHRALAVLESKGKVSTLITQNVDHLHQRAGNQQVIDLHGSLQKVVCLDCHQLTTRDQIQDILIQQNPCLEHLYADSAPDGDASLEGLDFSSIQVPMCENCGGLVKPQVVFYGENVPAERVQRCYAAVQRADAMLIVGSSLMVYSSYRFVRHAAVSGMPVAAINRGLTRADDLISLKIEEDCGEVLESLLEQLSDVTRPGSRTVLFP